MPFIINKKYQTSDVERVCQVKRVRLQTWLSAGWIVPSIQKASGHGTRNIFSENDLYKIAFFKRAIESGISRNAAAQFVPGIEEILAHDNKAVVQNLTDGTTGDLRADQVMACIFFRREGKVLASHLLTIGSDLISFSEFKESDDAIILNIRGLIEEVMKRL